MSLIHTNLNISPNVRSLWLTLILTLLTTLTANADQATELYNELFADKVNTALRSRDFDDNIATAAELIDTAKNSSDQPTFATLLTQKAYQLTSTRPDGYPTAVQALQFEIKLNPNQTPLLTKLVAMLQRHAATSSITDKPVVVEELTTAILNLADHYIQNNQDELALNQLRRANGIAKSNNSPRSDDIQNQLQQLTQLVNQKAKINRLVESLDINPDQPALAKQLIKLYITELDKPALALAYLPLTKDEQLAKNVMLAQKPVERMDEASAENLGTWYMELGDNQTNTFPKLLTYQRAYQYFDHYLTLHQKNDLSRKRIELYAKKTLKNINKLGGVALPASTQQTYDLIKDFDSSRHSVKGRWQKDNGKIRLLSSGNYYQFIFPQEIQNSYTLELEFTRIAGSGAIFITLPTFKDGVSLVLGGWDQTIHGLHYVDNKAANQNEATVKPGLLINGKKYHVLINMKYSANNHIDLRIQLDGKQIISWKGNANRLRASSHMPEPNRIGFTASGSLAEVSKAQLKTKLSTIHQ